jgi:hypothetical protein
MTERAKQLREVARQALYSTPNDQECEIPIMVATLRELVNQCAYTHLHIDGDHGIGVVNVKDIMSIIDELEKLNTLEIN